MNNEEIKKNDSVGFRVITQYLKDLSFESPNSPFSILHYNEKPKIELDVHINILNYQPPAEIELEENSSLYEVILSIKSKATKESDNNVIFHVELEYAGVFLIVNAKEEELRPILSIEAPRLLFPFARKILSDATQDGGFMPLVLDPIDFTRLYMENNKERSA